MTKTVSVKVMMGDSTVTEQKTFDPKKISDFFQKINQKLDDWSYKMSLFQTMRILEEFFQNLKLWKEII